MNGNNISHQPPESDHHLKLLVDFSNTELLSLKEAARPLFFQKKAASREGLDEHSEARFSEWFTFDWKDPKTGKTVIELFLGFHSEELSEEDLFILEGYKNHIYSAFEVKEVKSGKSLLLENLATGKSYHVQEFLATFQLAPQDLFIGRILPHKNHWILSGSGYPFRGDKAYMLKREYLRLKESSDGPLVDALSLEGVFSNLKKSSPKKQLSLAQLRKRMRRALRHFVTNPPLSLKELETWIVNDKTHEEIQHDIRKRSQFKNEKEIKTFFSLFHEFLNALPRKSRGGFSPREITEISPYGPKETMLTEDLMQATMHAIKPENYATPEELQKALNEFRENWLHTSQSELAGETPYKVILKERKAMGNPRTDFSIRMSVNRIQTVPYAERDLLLFRNEKIAIPGDFQRLISFCNTNGDAQSAKPKSALFNTLKKEGNFLLLPSRKDREDYLKFLIALSQKIKPLSFSGRLEWETLLRLASAWCLQLKWENLQREKIMQDYAHQFQEKLPSTLSHLGELAERKRQFTLRDLVYKMFASKKSLLDHDVNMRYFLFNVVERVLTRYYVWLGILKRKGRKAFHENPRYSMSNSGWALFVKLMENVSPQRVEKPKEK